MGPLSKRRRRPIEVPSGTIPNPSVLIEDLSAVSRGKAAAAPNKSSRDGTILDLCFVLGIVLLG